MQKIFNITDSDLEEIIPIIKENNLSEYKLDTKDFILYKENNEVVSFWRIYHIENNDYELSTLWVREAYRWKKLWIKIIIDLIQMKFDESNNLFLACKRELEDYYKKVYFQIIENNIPEKLLHTLVWAKENNLDAIIMKLCKK